ncbi:hypothetical protein DY000_02047929 [Brassica cretica]|uniref:Uncharacterized protein n=1 Tax=Brassica cretica TaxID=69181 RepID=A0ABQ7EXA2_BRACR|nr:hypothetical protein DY000_02047929 [Brassica cretica]
MPISTRSSKKELLFFSDPAHLERTIRKEKRTSSIDTTSTTSINTTSTTSIDTCDKVTIDSSTQTLFDTNPRAYMVATLVLQRDENGGLHDPGGHLCNAAEKDEDQDYIEKMEFMIEKVLKIQQKRSAYLNFSIAFGSRSTAMGDGEYASTLAMPELWNRLQGTDCNNKGTQRVAKIRDRIGEDRDAADLLSGLQNHPCATSAQPLF